MISPIKQSLSIPTNFQIFWIRSDAEGQSGLRIPNSSVNLFFVILENPRVDTHWDLRQTVAHKLNKCL